MITDVHSPLPSAKDTKKKRISIEVEGKKNEGVAPHTFLIWGRMEVK